MGPDAGAGGGTVIAQRSLAADAADPACRIGGFLTGKAVIGRAGRTLAAQMFDLGTIHLSTGAIHTVRPLEMDFPRGQLVAVTRVSGSGKTTMVLESLIPTLEASIKGGRLPVHVKSVSARGSPRSS